MAAMHLVAQWRAEAAVKQRVARDLRTEADDLGSLLTDVVASTGPHVWRGGAADRFAVELTEARADVQGQQGVCEWAADLLDQEAAHLLTRARDREEWLRAEAARAAAAAAEARAAGAR
jgi:hypothetical protein